MGSGASARSSDAVAHFGVKGMHWGVRKGQQTSAPARTPAPRTSEDTKNVQKHFGTIEKHGVGALSNKELQEVVSRLNLMQQYSNLTNPHRGGKDQHNPLAAVDAGHSMVKKILAYNETYGKIVDAKNSHGVAAVKKGFKAAKAGVKIYKTAKAAKTIAKTIL